MRAITFLTILAFVALAGCDGEKQTAAPVAEAAKKKEAVAIVGAVWTMERLDGKSVVAGSGVTLTLHTDGRISGQAGCNRYMGGYKMTAEGAVSFPTPLATTRMACADPAMAEQERVYIDLLGRVTQAKLAEDSALILTTDHNRVIRYIAAPAM